MRRFLYLVTKKCRIYAACGVSQTPNVNETRKEFFMIFSGKKRNPPKREEFLKNALKETQKSFENAYKGLENVDDPDLIDLFIYEINAANLRYKVLLRDIKNSETGKT